MAITKISPSVVDFDAGITISTADNLDTLTLTSTDADANSGPNLRLYRNSSSPADNDALGFVEWEGRNDNSQDVIYGQIGYYATDVSDGTEDSNLYINTIVGGTVRNRINAYNNEVVINEESIDSDFRVESNGNANMLFVDGGNDSVLVGHNTDISLAGESHELQVYDTNFSTISAATFRNGSDGACITLGHSRSGTIGTQTVLQDGDTMGAINFMGSDGTDMASYGARIYVEVDGTPGSNDMPGRINFATTADGANGSTDRMRIDSSGYAQFGTTITTHIGTSQVFINRGVNAAPATSGTTQTGGALRLRGGNNAVIDMGMNSTDTWIQATDRANLANGYNLSLNPNGGGVTIGDSSAESGAYASAKTLFLQGGESVQIIKNTSASDSSHRVAIGFLNSSGTGVGYISNNSSATAFITSSDHRLKENVTYDWDALTRLRQLKPARFNFKVDSDNTVDGFLAHEAQAIVPEAVTGTHNETKDLTNVVLNEFGNVIAEGVTEDDWKDNKISILWTKDDLDIPEGVSVGDVRIKSKYDANTTWKAEHTKDVYQGIDQSKLVPLLVKAVQELEAKVKALEEA